MKVKKNKNKQIHEEYQYLDLVKNIIKNGESRDDRTGTGTLSLFSPGQLRFSLKDGALPLLTTKKVFFRGVVEELLWFISGNTNVKKLQERNIHFWDQNTNREFLDKQGLGQNKEWDAGPIYGFQWKHFGANYITCDTDYTGQGINQLEYVVDLIKNNPESRRIVISAWNPADTKKMALPPCHIIAQFYVHNEDRKTKKRSLSCHLYQRSGDIGLGVPFNIASYALFTHMIAHITETNAKELILSIGDAHIYKNHVKGLQLQMKRIPRMFPKIAFKSKKYRLEDFTFTDFVLSDYKPHDKIKLEIS